MRKTSLKREYTNEDMSIIREDHDWWVKVTPPNCVLIGWTDRDSAVFQNSSISPNVFTMSGIIAEYIHSLINKPE